MIGDATRLLNEKSVCCAFGHAIIRREEQNAVHDQQTGHENREQKREPKTDTFEHLDFFGNQIPFAGYRLDRILAQFTPQIRNVHVDCLRE